MHPYVKQIQAAYPDNVRLVLRYVLFHKGSEEAVRILETAREQGVYEPVLDAVAPGVVAAALRRSSAGVAMGSVSSGSF